MRKNNFFYKLTYYMLAVIVHFLFFPIIFIFLIISVFFTDNNVDEDGRARPAR
jgi:hypothetical protein